MKGKTNYEDIINLPHHVSSKRPQMSMLDRAAQFSPFAALTGYDDAIHETGRLTDEKIDLSEEEKEALDRKQQFLMERLGGHPALTVTYFVPSMSIIQRSNSSIFLRFPLFVTYAPPDFFASGTK